ncbi:hypothetical protein AVEN_40844-1 [Araneus ventricosus]|uniref:Uncharacterized protein n=1 Tax=Araneus ventricosus TaxID=182803 RepID=A0A4Y2J2F6_ARAVE|nr:hypothetical protein AVEN_40844-1 [Araneus ventricosus]
MRIITVLCVALSPNYYSRWVPWDDSPAVLYRLMIDVLGMPKKGGLWNCCNGVVQVMAFIWECLLSVQLTSFLARTADETRKSFPMDQRYYSSESNSLLARTADRTPKAFALQGDPSRSTFFRHPSALLIESPPAGRDVTWNHLVHSSVSPLLIEISRRFQHL